MINPNGQENETTRASLELLYHVSRELATALDLRTVLQRVLFLSIRNVGAINGTLIVLDDNGQAVESTIVIGEQIHNHTTSQLRVTLERGLAGWVARQRQAVLVPDTSQDERWLHRPDDAPDRTGAKSAVSAPLLVRDRLVGVMTLVHPDPGFFTLEHLALMQAIADQASIAVLNARLYAESQRQARVMTAVAESAAVITATLRLDDVLQRILEQISHALHVEVVSLALIDPLEEYLEFRASTGSKNHNVVGMRLQLGQGIAGWVATEGQGTIVPDVREDSRFYPEIDRLTGFETLAVACAPIRSQDKVIGIIEALNPKDGYFDPDALLVLTGVGSLAGTAIRHAQLFESLQAAHQRYRELFEDSIDTILITDWKGNILEANRQAELLTNYGEEELLHTYIGQLHSLDNEKLAEDFVQLNSGDALSYESVLHTRHGREVPIQVYVREVLIEGVSHLQWILRDITERVNLDNLRDDLISMIYHDLRSPLGNIVSSLDVLDSMLPAQYDPAFRSLLNIAMRSTDRIQRLTSCLLDINRLEAGQPVGNRTPTDPIILIRDAVEAVIPVVNNKNQELTVAACQNLPLILVDADMIRRVLSNLLENAVKFSPPGGKISVSAQAIESQVQICVQDAGPGIPPSDNERIFDKYTRLHAKEGPKGLGLGLAYCRLAVEGHSGKIWVDSQPGEGARFCFTLPLAPE
jgi:two-component system, NtrC family, sensor histidine kinase KinB